MTSRDRRCGDDGFTLVETMIVLGLIALIAVVIGATFSVMVRGLPPTEARVDDARAQLGLTNWLPQDVLSAAETGFERGPYTARCAAASIPAGSVGLLQLRWSEGSSAFVVDYRYVRHGTGGTGHISRLSCAAGQPATSLTMTPTLHDLAGTTQTPAPVNVEFVAVTTAEGLPGHRGVRFEVEIVDPVSGARRELVSLDATTANVVTNLPATPTTSVPPASTTTGPPNDPPVAGALWMTASNDVAETITVPATDPEGQPLTVTIDAAPPVLDVSALVGLDVRVLATGATLGATYDFDYEVTDDANHTASGIVHVTIVDALTPPSTSTTTTTTTTTTTATLPCSASITSVSLASVQRTGQGHLNKDVVVTIAQNGACAPLVLTFDPDPDDDNAVPEQLAFEAGESVTIGKNDYVWDATPSPGLTLILQEGANGSSIDMERLVVT